MLKGLALTPPVVGRIAIGKVIESNGKRLPAKDDEFTITSQIQTSNGWIPHPLDQQLREQADDAATGDKANSKLRRIPIRLLFDDPDLNLRATYSLFDRQSGRPLCVGNGEVCKRVNNGQIEQHPCPSPEACPLAQGGQCKPYARMNVHIGEEDTLGSFIFRTTGYNSIRTLATRLRYFHAVSNGKLSTLPLELRLRGKSTTQSYRRPIYYVDLLIDSAFTLSEAIQQAQDEYQQRQDIGFNQQALDEAARLGFAQGAFEDSAEEAKSVIDEFYPDEVITQHGEVALDVDHDDSNDAKTHAASTQQPLTLAAKLAHKSANITS